MRYSTDYTRALGRPAGVVPSWVWILVTEDRFLEILKLKETSPASSVHLAATTCMLMLPCSLPKSGITKSRENPQSDYPNCRGAELKPNTPPYRDGPQCSDFFGEITVQSSPKENSWWALTASDHLHDSYKHDTDHWTRSLYPWENLTVWRHMYMYSHYTLVREHRFPAN